MSDFRKRFIELQASPESDVIFILYEHLMNSSIVETSDFGGVEIYTPNGSRLFYAAPAQQLFAEIDRRLMNQKFDEKLKELTQDEKA